MKYVAYIVKGLENICVQELSALPDIKIISTSPKHIVFEYTSSPSNLLSLKTIDDIGIYLSEFKLNDFLEGKYTNILDIENLETSVLPVLSSIREIKNTFSITLSIYKANIEDKISLQDNLAQYLAETTGYSYIEGDHSNLDFRFNIEEDNCLVTLKLNPTSLFKRKYSHISTLGSLRSTIAASIILSLLFKEKDKSKYSELKLVDNFCGSGTFLCEGYSFGLDLYGGDINKEAVDITKRNLHSLGIVKPNVFIQNAIKTNFQDKLFDIGVANFPWDKQIPIKSITSLYDLSIKEYSRILKDNGSFGFIGYKPEIIIKYIKKYFPSYKIEEIKIGYLGQTPTIVLAYK